MPIPRRRLLIDAEPLSSALTKLRADLDVPGDFPAVASDLAGRAIDRFADGRVDATELPLVAVDPPGARDLDQAFALEHTSDGWVLDYAIADVAAFIVPGDAVDLASRERGSTLYLPDGKAPLHPKTLSEGAASLLPGENRPALWWKLTFDNDGELANTEVRRATVRVRVATSYEVITAVLADGPNSGEDNAGSATATTDTAFGAPASAHAIDLQAPDGDPLAIAAERGIDLLEVATSLRDFGIQRLAVQADRGGVSLQLPEQDVEVDGSGEVHLVATPSMPAEEWNAQMSLATGIAAAQLMLEATTGLLRTLPDAEPEILAELKRASEALGHPWPSADAVGDANGQEGKQGVNRVYGAWVRSLDPATPIGAALMLTATKGLRGSGYAAFHGELPELTTHSAVASAYAHVTAPLRRLGDRYAAELALAAFDNRPAPDWVLDVLDDLPEILNDGNRHSSSVDRAVVDLLEAAVLAPHVGAEFPAVVLSHWRDGLRVQVTEPPVIADASGKADDGDAVKVRLDTADPKERETRFTIIQ